MALPLVIAAGSILYKLYKAKKYLKAAEKFAKQTGRAVDKTRATNAKTAVETIQNTKKADKALQTRKLQTARGVKLDKKIGKRISPARQRVADEVRIGNLRKRNNQIAGAAVSGGALPLIDYYNEGNIKAGASAETDAELNALAPAPVGPTIAAAAAMQATPQPVGGSHIDPRYEPEGVTVGNVQPMKGIPEKLPPYSLGVQTPLQFDPRQVTEPVAGGIAHEQFPLPAQVATDINNMPIIPGLDKPSPAQQAWQQNITDQVAGPTIQAPVNAPQAPAGRGGRVAPIMAAAPVAKATAPSPEVIKATQAKQLQDAYYADRLNPFGIGSGYEELQRRRQ